MNGPLEVYRQRIEQGELTADPAQAYAVEQLQLLATRVTHWETARDRRVLNLIFNRAVDVPRGLYMFGRVGRGKTMLMDLFYENVDFKHKQRMHFHPFMRKVHALIKEFRALDEEDPISAVARRMMSETRLLCLDEIQVTDITDAMILGRLFTAMFERELIVVTTSNAAPFELYKDGLNRQLFLPFVDLIQDKMELLQLDGPKDYRTDMFQKFMPHYLSPDNEAARLRMDEIWSHWAGRVPPHDGGIEVNGRYLPIPAMASGMARFSFEDLCARPLGTHDYLALSETFDTIFIEHIPLLDASRHNEARRFMNLIDTLHDRNIRMVVSAAAEPEELYVEGAGAEEFKRTASRLNLLRGAS